MTTHTLPTFGSYEGGRWNTPTDAMLKHAKATGALELMRKAFELTSKQEISACHKLAVPPDAKAAMFVTLKGILPSTDKALEKFVAAGKLDLLAYCFGWKRETVVRFARKGYQFRTGGGWAYVHAAHKGNSLAKPVAPKPARGRSSAEKDYKPADSTVKTLTQAQESSLVTALEGEMTKDEVLAMARNGGFVQDFRKGGLIQALRGAGKSRLAQKLEAILAETRTQRVAAAAA